MDLVDLADQYWRGATNEGSPNPMAASGHLSEVANGVAFLPSFGNCTAIDTDEGLVMVDTGSQLNATRVFDAVRAWSKKPLHTAIFSHGHIDHVFGVDPFDEEAAREGWPRPHVLAHANVAPRFDRYLLTRGFNEVINRRQFALPTLHWPDTFRYPDETYDDEHTLCVGERTIFLRHEKGETDDATVSWLAEERVLCSGDLFVWSSPNAGNPQKVQRYPLEWANALRRMAALEPEILLPGHGLPIFGAARVAQALGETAEFLEDLVAQTLAMMNAGARLSEVLHQVRPPAHLEGRAYLQPIYDEPEFIVHNVWRLYGGWWDGNPAHLKPAPERRLAEELCALSGGPARLGERCETLLEAGDDEALRLAGHLIEMAWLCAPEDPAIQALRQRVFRTRAEQATSTMARGVFSWAVRESRGEEV